MVKFKKLQARIITALVGCPVIVTAVYHGGVPFLIMVVLLATLCLSEFLQLIHGKNKEAHQLDIFVYTISLVLIVSTSMVETKWLWNLFPVKILAGTIIIFFLIELFTEKIYFKGISFIDNLRGIFYVGFMFSFFILIREMPCHGLGYTIFLIFSVWTNDTFAYFIGLMFGKHKLNKKISPKKSVEGSWGGFIATIIFALIFARYLSFNPWQAVFMGATLSLLAQGGDLLESLVKRAANRKNSSEVLPGHGGFLDRMDSFILAGPVYYFIILYFC
ncbi:MAG: phosphatidate cytidylyltransferase [Candidatus Margulisbacteria bacterium]|nr:phosphatidate cytidylyltransferase [Candidatus Margulisiibacteriota bacterium]